MLDPGCKVAIVSIQIALLRYPVACLLRRQMGSWVKECIKRINAGIWCNKRGWWHGSVVAPC